MTDIQVMDVDQETREVIFGIKPKILKGFPKLIQMVVISLLNVPGKDLLDPGKGGGLQAMIGTGIDPNDATSVFSELVRRIKKAESEVISDQIGSSDPPEAKLSQIQLVDIQTGDSIDQILVTVRVINQTGQASDIVV
jgi:ribosomal protein RSM22 (predicted rRNA methylase)